MRGSDADTAFRVAEGLRAAGSWDVFGERVRRYEMHFNGRSVELVRGPIHLEGFAVRLLRSADGKTASGRQSSTDLSPAGIRTAVEDAERILAYSEFPAKAVQLPLPIPEGPGTVEILDRRLWDRPLEAMDEFLEALFAAFDGRKDEEPTFGSVRAALGERTLANSEGMRAAYAHTTVELELAVKASGGPEGAPPGEYWVNDAARRLETSALAGRVDSWCTFARDARRAKPPPTGSLPVVLPASVLAGILPPVIGYRCTGAARLREIAPAPGARWGSERVTIHDDGRVPWAVGSSPVDDEGTPQRRRTLLAHGAVSEILYDAMHAGAFDTRSTGNAVRAHEFAPQDWHRFLNPLRTSSTTLVVEPGDGGGDDELVEAVEDGLWVQQLGWAVPDPLSGSFGGELRIGYRIRNGQKAEPVRGGTVGGVVLAPPGTPSLLGQVVAVGSRGELVEGVDSPTLLVRGLPVAGA